MLVELIKCHEKSPVLLRLHVVIKLGFVIIKILLTYNICISLKLNVLKLNGYLKNQNYSTYIVPFHPRPHHYMYNG